MRTNFRVLNNSKSGTSKISDQNTNFISYEKF